MKNAITTAANRNALDFYPSPRWFTTELLRHIEIPQWAIIGEPCVGDGAIAQPLRDAGHHVWTNDLDINQVADYCEDATQGDAWRYELPRADWIITNPPYSGDAAKILYHAYAHVSQGVALFVRLTFLEGCEDRREFFQQHPPSNILIFPRYAFRRGKSGGWATDSTPVVAVVWDKRDKSGETKMLWLSPDQIEGFYRNPEEAPV